ncbi:MAG TPA: DUF1963 domain-containing protein [Nocardioides sp.]|nr:DUF1963 domain-containing protein [Nocardioides sp.]
MTTSLRDSPAPRPCPLTFRGRSGPATVPLGFVAEVDLAVLARAGLDAGLALPTDGRLLAFYFDDPEGTGAVVVTSDPDSFPGSRLLHVSHTAPTTDPLVELTGVQVPTWPDHEHPVLERQGLNELPDPFVEALGRLLEGELGDAWGRHLGGWARPVQGPVELEVSETRLGEATHDDAHEAEALGWRPLLQIDSDHAAGPSWRCGLSLLAGAHRRRRTTARVRLRIHLAVLKEPARASAITAILGQHRRAQPSRTDISRSGCPYGGGMGHPPGTGGHSNASMELPPAVLLPVD